MTNATRRRNAAAITIVLLAIATIVLAFLWLRQLQTPPKVVEKVVEKPVEVVKEVEVERLREVPKEVIVTKEVQVPAQLTDAQQAAMDIAARFTAAPMISSPDEVLYKLDAVRVDIYLDDSIRKILTEDRVRNRFELILRQYNIPIDQKSPVLLAVYVEGLWDQQETNLTWDLAVELQQPVTMERRGELRKTNATLWREALTGDVRRRGTEPVILRAVEAKAESFANKYLAIQAKVP